MVWVAVRWSMECEGAYSATWVVPQSCGCGGGEVAVSELLLYVEQRVAGGQPRGCSGVSEGVQWHVAQGGVLECVGVPFPDGPTVGWREWLAAG